MNYMNLVQKVYSGINSDYIFRAIDSEYKKNVSNKDSITCKVYIDNEEYSIPQSVILYSMNQW